MTSGVIRMQAAATTYVAVIDDVPLAPFEVVAVNVNVFGIAIAAEVTVNVELFDAPGASVSEVGA